MSQLRSFACALAALATLANLSACETAQADPAAAPPQTLLAQATEEGSVGTAALSTAREGSAQTDVANPPPPTTSNTQTGDPLGLTPANTAEGSAVVVDVAPEISRVTPETCTYDMYNWSVSQRRAVNHRSVNKRYEEVEGDERDPEDARCTVCSEDQERVDVAALGIDGVGDIRVCWAHRANVEAALRDIAASGEFEIQELVAYRPGRTRGAVRDDMRQELSNHSYGTAIDMNAGDNGLYRDCNLRELTVSGIAGCTLGVGGAWNPQSRPRTSITRDSVVYRAFTGTAGWQWGGEISGSTRDIMHFSLTGY